MKMKKDHRIPLSACAIAIVKEMAEVRRSDSGVPARSRAIHWGSRILLSVVQRLRTGMHHTRVPIGRSGTGRLRPANFPDIMSWRWRSRTAVPNAVEAAYRRGDLFEKRRKLMDAWAGFCGQASTATVVPLRRQG